MHDRFDRDAEFFRVVDSMSGEHPVGSLDFKRYFFGWFFSMIEIGGMREWAQAGVNCLFFLFGVPLTGRAPLPWNLIAFATPRA